MDGETEVGKILTPISHHEWAGISEFDGSDVVG
jgi:hypothetical protein